MHWKTFFFRSVQTKFLPLDEKFCCHSICRLFCRVPLFILRILFVLVPRFSDSHTRVKFLFSLHQWFSLICRKTYTRLWKFKLSLRSLRTGEICRSIRRKKNNEFGCIRTLQTSHIYVRIFIVIALIVIVIIIIIINFFNTAYWIMVRTMARVCWIHPYAICFWNICVSVVTAKERRNLNVRWSQLRPFLYGSVYYCSTDRNLSERLFGGRQGHAPRRAWQLC